VKCYALLGVLSMQVSIFGVTMGNFPDKRQPVSERFHRITTPLSNPEEIGNRVLNRERTREANREGHVRP